MSKRLIIGGVVCIAATETAIASYLLKRTLIRGKADVERTKRMSGTNWVKYIPEIKRKRDWLIKEEHKDLYIKSNDNLKLHGTLFPRSSSKKIVICLHGYSSSAGISDYTAISKFYLDMNFNMLMIDARAHGRSEGKYIGFGCLDRNDLLKWIEYVIEMLGDDCEILLHGTSMGAATVLMASGLELPKNVKGIISDCAFTSAWEVFSDVLKSMYHIPPYPIINIASRISKKIAGYSLNQCNSSEEVKKAKVPILFIHGDNDTFVPCSMSKEIYKNCISPKSLFIVKDAGHAESYYKDTINYEKKVKEFIERYLFKGEVIINA
ncbi:alpha/beta hydrolase [Clostridioides difficile]